MPVQTTSGRAAAYIGKGCCAPLRLGRPLTDIGLTNGTGPRRTFKSRLMTGRFQVSGVTRDKDGVPVAGATVTLYAEGAGPLAWTTSDGSGNYAFDYVGVGAVYVRATKAGPPELAGTTLVFAPVSV